MDNLSLIDISKADVLQSAMNELISYKNQDSTKVVSKESLGLGNIDNTSDLNKPVSTKQKQYIDDSDNEIKASIAEFKTTVYTKTQVDNLLSSLKFIKFVSELPTTDISENTLYLIPLENGETGNQFIEYVYTGTSWEQIGTLNIDLSNYYTKNECNNLISNRLPMVLITSPPSGLVGELGQLCFDEIKKKIYVYTYDGHAVNCWKDITPSSHLVFEDVVVSSDMFTTDTTYDDYGYKVEIPLSGVTQNMLPNVTFDLNDAVSGIFAPISKTYYGGLFLYAKEIKETTIPTIDIINVYMEGV